ncbi:MAG: TlpA family protein disulfide reductase [Limisphaerales bacterium]
MTRALLLALAAMLLASGVAAGGDQPAPAISRTEPASTSSVSVDAKRHAPQFALSDQFAKTHEFRFPRDRVTVLTVADKKGSSQLDAWIQPLHHRYADRIHLDGLADMGAAPGPLRGIIRAAFRKQVAHPVMLDWKGTTARAFNYERKKANVYVIDRCGRITHRVAGEMSGPDLEALNAAIDAALKLPPPEATPPAPTSPPAVQGPTKPSEPAR